MSGSDLEGHGGLRSHRTALDRAALFGAGFIAAIMMGLLVGVVTAVAVASAVGYSTVTLGGVLLLAGGLAGGGYSVLGIGKGVGRYTFAAGNGNKSSLEELGHGYRPEADPVAFWQVIGGLGYVALGLAILALA